MANNGNQQFAAAAMLIRKPITTVFNAFIDPAVTTRFWFTKSTGKLETGKEVAWTWEMYNVTTAVKVKAVETNKRIFIEWEGSGTVEWTFQPLNDSATFVSIVNTGFDNDTDIIAKVRDSTEGFTLVLAGLKAYLEHDIELGLVGDRFPKGL